MFAAAEEQENSYDEKNERQKEIAKEIPMHNSSD